MTITTRNVEQLKKFQMTQSPPERLPEQSAPAEGELEIPITALSADALLGVIDDFVLREGTEYGPREVTLEAKREQVLMQLRARTARIVFDPETETCSIVVR